MMPAGNLFLWYQQVVPAYSIPPSKRKHMAHSGRFHPFVTAILAAVVLVGLTELRIGSAEKAQHCDHLG